MFERLEICHDWCRHWGGHCHGARSTNRPGLPCAFFTPTLLPTLFFLFIKRTCIIWGTRHLDRNIRHRQLNLGLDFCNRRGTRNKQIFRPSFGRGIPRGRRFYTRTTCWANKGIVLQNRSPPNCAPRFFDLRHNIPLVGFYRTGVKCQGRPQCCARRAWVEPPLPCIRCRSWGKFFHNCFWNRRWNWPTSTATKAGRTRCQWRASAAVVVAHHGPRPRRHGWRWEKLLSGETESFVVLIGHESSKIVGSKKVSCLSLVKPTNLMTPPLLLTFPWTKITTKQRCDLPRSRCFLPLCPLPFAFFSIFPFFFSFSIGSTGKKTMMWLWMMGAPRNKTIPRPPRISFYCVVHGCGLLGVKWPFMV